MLPGNAEAIEAWNTVLFEKFLRFRDVVTKGLGLHGDRALALYPPERGWHVVDIGCGFGDTSLELGRRVGPNGRVTGVDAAANFLAAGRDDAGRAGLDNVHFEVADVEEHVPGGPYDLAFSRMGTMFFASPVFAFRNTRKVLKPGARLVMSVWRRKDLNEVFFLAEQAMHAILGDPPKGDQITCGPGPFSMASADLVSDLLHAAGFRDPVFHRHDAPIKVGNDLEEAVQFSLTIGPAGEVVRLAGAAATQRMRDIEQALRDVLAPWRRDDGSVWAPSTTWIVSATNPAP